jgi:hypothetical protein
VLDPTTVVVAGDRGRVAPWEVWSRTVTIDPPCEETITGRHDGRLTAGAGGLCLVDAEVRGPVSVEDGGRLIIQDSDVTGPVTSTAASVVSICGSQIKGPVSLSGTTGTVAVGDTTAGCDPSTVIGPLRITDTSGPVVMDRSEVTGRVAVSGSGSLLATVLSGLTVNGSITCSQNAVEPTDAGVSLTVSGAREGQCVA